MANVRLTLHRQKWHDDLANQTLRAALHQQVRLVPQRVQHDSRRRQKPDEDRIGSPQARRDLLNGRAQGRARHSTRKRSQGAGAHCKDQGYICAEEGGTYRVTISGLLLRSRRRECVSLMLRAECERACVAYQHDDVSGDCEQQSKSVRTEYDGFNIIAVLTSFERLRAINIHAHTTRAKTARMSE